MANDEKKSASSPDKLGERGELFGALSAARPSGAAPRKTQARPDPVKPEKSSTLPPDAVRKTGDEFGIEGTNKTVARPKPDNAPSDELGLGPHIEKTPYRRG